MTLKQLFFGLVQVRLELLLMRDSVSGGRKHIADVKVWPPVVIVVAPSSRHSGTDVLDTHVLSHVAERTIVISIEIVASEVVGNVDI